MRFATYGAANEIPFEQDIEQRCGKLFKRDDVAPTCTFGIKNLDGALRAIVTCHTHSEAAAVTQLLDEKNFQDASLVEESDEFGNVVISSVYVQLPPGVDTLYVPQPSC